MKLYKRIIIYFLFVFILWFIIESIIFSKEIIAAVNLTTKRCVNVLFPSLFGFMVVSDYLVRSGLYGTVSVIFYPLAKFIFKMPPQLFIVFLLSNIGGYPVGIKLLGQLCENNTIDKKTAENMAVFCYSSGPSFIIGVIGLTVFGSVRIGILIYLSCLISNVILALLFGYFKGYNYSPENNEINLSSQMLIESISDCGKKLLNICLMVIAFSYLTTILECLNVFRFLNSSNGINLVKAFLEITNITNIDNDLRIIPVVTSITSTGGICVLLQAMSIKSKTLKLNKFLIARIPSCLLSGIISCILLRAFPIYNTCNVTYYTQKSGSEYNILSLICLFFMIIIIFFQKKGSNLKNNVL